ncbi:enoyl-CoA hydratase/isomerase family protein [Pseudomonas fluorescens]|uniref:enoyl-CoA hydratase/isomerase family protein n=1 Tax=Pseudomonas TaxID=286 RepID=UPI0007174C48|nr:MULTISPECIES: enoyl-CoA hydratase-related protein [Pseudomonas]AYG07399.1 enoyl-CoA hydratase/isomerase family protein [Pseudomonas fluorescens]MDZ4301135.1 enoyl-CoA hydratase-related protein [Pseudomonas sp.]NMX30965.1 enoyl-CoA hydratase/isomerase family protein [Pseudomonas sp. WS 5413]OAE16134.1 enoyl-CoA hydratase [Pseudomonas brenneri]MBU4630561.1 enoyl-CoA hydratase/isomerase family protein [Pseudomonas sp. BF61]
MNACETLLLEPHNGVLHITLNRPQNRNAMSVQMVSELRAVLTDVARDEQVRALVISGAGGHFCAGADVKDMSRAGSREGLRDLNRVFGALLQEVEALPQVVIVVLQGAVLGGGFGLACVSDIAIADHQAQFGLPETSLGVLPAQIAPFVVRRIGLTHARRLALTAARFDGVEAQRLGVVHFVEHAPQGLAQRLDEVLGQVLRCAPRANARTKALLLQSLDQPLELLLDQAADWFAEAVTGEEGIEGTRAFVEKRKARWVS